MIQRLKLQHKIILGYTVPILVLVLVTLWGAAATQAVAANFSRVSIAADLTDKTHHLEIAHHRMASGTRGYILEPEPSFVDLYERGESFLRETTALFRAEQFSPEVLTQNFAGTAAANVSELRVQLNPLIERIEQAATQYRNLLNTAQRGDRDQAQVQFGRLADLTIDSDFIDINRQLHTVYQNLVIAQQDLIAESLGRLLWGLLGLSLGLGGLAGIVIWLIALGVSRSINRTAGIVSASALEIVGTIEQQEQTANDQASSVNETTTTMEELAISSQQSAEQAQKAAQAAVQALAQAEAGNQAVAETLAGMADLKANVEAIAAQIDRLNQRNAQIGSISQLMSNISNQTNMLALNASVEAVRAGERGKGFAVVAAEIRKLADESQRSASQINDLVREIQSELKSTVTVAATGTQTAAQNAAIAQKAAAALAAIATAIDNMVASNQQISLNIQQQANAVQQINIAMSRLNQGARAAAQGIAQTRQETQQLQIASQRLKAIV